MKILEVIQVFSYEHFAVGTTDIIYHISKGLAENNHEVVIYTCDYKLAQNFVDSLLQYKVKVINFKIWLSLAGLYITPSMLKRGGEIKNFDIIHIHAYRTFQNIIVTHYANKYNVPYVFQAEGSLVTFFQKGLQKKIFDVIWGNTMIKNATKVIASSQMEADQYKKLGIPDKKIVITPFGIDLSKFQRLPSPGKFRKKYGIDDNHKIILFLARLNKIKGIDFLLDEFTEISNVDSNVQLFIVGPDDGYLNHTNDLIEKFGINNKVHITGPLYGDEKLEAYIDADVYVLPSYHEDFGLTVLEAMACGTPVIVTDQCGTAEIVKNQAGYVVPLEKNQLKSAILNILNDDNIRQKFSETGKSLVHEKYNWGKIAEQLESVYLECMNK
jgi:glycosyltransferase involved in cell wall biosynthesis